MERKNSLVWPLASMETHHRRSLNGGGMLCAQVWETHHRLRFVRLVGPYPTYRHVSAYVLIIP